jgi:hypothetical protein
MIVDVCLWHLHLSLHHGKAWHPISPTLPCILWNDIVVVWSLHANHLVFHLQLRVIHNRIFCSACCNQHWWFFTRERAWSLNMLESGDLSLQYWYIVIWVLFSFGFCITYCICQSCQHSLMIWDLSLSLFMQWRLMLAPLLYTVLLWWERSHPCAVDAVVWNLSLSNQHLKVSCSKIFLTVKDKRRVNSGWVL